MGRLTFGSLYIAYGMPVMTTALPARSEKSSPSLTLPLQRAVQGCCCQIIPVGAMPCSWWTHVVTLAAPQAVQAWLTIEPALSRLWQSTAGVQQLD